MKKFDNFIIIFVIFIVIFLYDDIKDSLIDNFKEPTYLEKISDEKFKYLNNNEPNFQEEDFTTESFESYSDLDELGRCGTAFANIGVDLMPTKKRDYIGMIKPSGWQYTKYDFIEGNYLYNRCHLIAYQLTGENANPKNLITCTKQMNSEVMVEFENIVGNYIRKTKNHVLYRVTPKFIDNNLIADGVEIEAESVEDKGEEIKFHVFIYNMEDNIEINYLDGSSRLVDVKK